MLFAGFLTFFDALAKQGKLDSVCVMDMNQNNLCPQSAAQAISDYKTELTIGGVGTLLGIAMLTFGFIAHDTGDMGGTTSAVTVHPSAGGLRGTF